MKYMGSKARIAKDLEPILTKHLNDNRYYVEPFAGGMNMICNINHPKRLASDRNNYLIAMWRYLCAGFEFPKTISKELYSEYRAKFNQRGFNGLGDTLEEAMIGWIGFMGSFNGRFYDGGYSSHNSNGVDFIGNQIKNTLSQVDKLQGVEFWCGSYDSFKVSQESVYYCFDDKTEILTDRGWINVGDVRIGDKCFSREPNTNKLDYIDVVNTISYNYCGDIYEYQSKNLDFCVTPNHRMFCCKKYGRKHMLNDTFIAAKDMENSYFRFISAGGIWDVDDDDYINICGDVFKKDDFAYLLGLFLTDGSVNKKGITTISQSKENILKKAIAVCDRIGIKYSVYKNKERSVNTIYLSRKYLPFFKQFYLKKNRRIPVEFKNSSRGTIQQLLDGIVDGDSDKERRRIVCGSKPLVDDIQELCYKIGKSSCIKAVTPKTTYLKKEDRFIVGKEIYYIVSINNKPYLHFVKDNLNKKNYNGIVNCVTLDKWHTVLVRRNGKAFWCGQCDPPYKGTKQYLTSKDFNHDAFYSWCRRMTIEGNDVIISEYQAPEDFVCVWQKQVTNSMSLKNTYKPTEKLFVHESIADKYMSNELKLF